jgi:transposase InsO family protein
MQNGYVESFNGRLRDECLKEYNDERPRISPAYRTRAEFAKTCSELTSRIA